MSTALTYLSGEILGARLSSLTGSSSAWILFRSVGSLLGLLEEEFVEDVFDVHRADVFKRVNPGRKAVVADGLVEFLDHLLDRFHLPRRGLDDDAIAAAVGHHAHFL